MNKEFVKYATEKIAEAVPSLWNTVAAAGIVIGVAAIADMIIDYLRDKWEEHKSKEYYIKMLEAHPQLQKADPIVVARYWASLNHFAPNMAQDPLAAGAYITQSINRLSSEELGGPPPDTYGTLSSIQKSYTDFRSKTHPPTVSTTARNLAISAILGTALGKKTSGTDTSSGSKTKK